MARPLPDEHPLVQPLIDQLAAGQSEVLYSLQTASAAVGRRTSELAAVAAELPQALTPKLQAILGDLGEDAAALHRSATEELRTAADHLEALRQQFQETVSDSITLLQRVRSAAVTEAEAAVTDISQAGADLTDRLRELLDERDERDRQLEQKLNARIARLTQKVDVSVRRAIGELQDELDLLHHRDKADRAAAAEQLTALLDQLLRLPRRKLRALRADLAHDNEEDAT